ncbi:filament-like plant protein 1 [Dorcoceras hygrometricum]|uniref:Filament-like plant protein 1 n=1 Tax=Dorcoceras hygrometricum TaxID=472368 RepID=A0A2Z7CGA0_9LAMI|nr:filament-like plant protein 1 [Dorcoceras hygrometricum]
MVVMTKQALQTMTFVGQGIFSPIQIWEIDWVTYFLPKIDPASKGKETLVVMTKHTPVEEHCHMVLNYTWDNVSTRMNTFDDGCTSEKSREEQEQAATQDQIKQIVQQDIVNETEHQQQGSTDNPTQPEDPSVNITDTVKNPGPDPTSEDNNTDHQGPNPSHLQMVAYTADSEEDTRLSFLEVQVDLFGLKTLSIDSKMHSMESKLCSMNSNIDQMMDTQKSLKLEFGRHKHIFHDKMNTLAGTVTSSQTALKTSIIRQLAVQ